MFGKHRGDRSESHEEDSKTNQIPINDCPPHQPVSVGSKGVECRRCGMKM